MERAQFEALVARAVASLPKRVQEHLAKNVALCVEDRPTRTQLQGAGVRKGETLLGLYEGVPETSWGKGFGGELPEKITLFQGPLEEAASTKEELAEEIRQTIWHEIAHHVGFGDEELEGA